MIKVRVLAETDFVEIRGQLVPRCRNGDFFLIIAHSNLYGPPMGDIDRGGDEIWDFFRAIIVAAEEFPEFETCLVNYDDVPNVVQRLGLARYGSSDFAEAMIYSSTACIQHIIHDGETLESIRLWLHGTSLALGLRATAKHADLIARLAYELAEPHNISFSDARWGVANFRSKVYRAAQEAIKQLTEVWAKQSPT